MSTPARQQSTLLPSELFFLAEDTQVTVIPRESLAELELIGLKTPKLMARRRSDLPLWTALLLKSQRRVQIVPPDWLKEENLREFYDEEVRNNDSFSRLPWHWLEIGQAILDAAPDDLDAPSHVIRSLLRDLREIRQAKVRQGLDEVNESHIAMDNLGGMEVNEIRPFVRTVMDKLRKITDQVENDEDEDM